MNYDENHSARAERMRRAVSGRQALVRKFDVRCLRVPMNVMGM